MRTESGEPYANRTDAEAAEADVEDWTGSGAGDGAGADPEEEEGCAAEAAFWGAG